MFCTTPLLLLLFAGLSLITTLTFAFGPLMLDSFLDRPTHLTCQAA
jgi:hypothetical protein